MKGRRVAVCLALGVALGLLGMCRLGPMAVWAAEKAGGTGPGFSASLSDDSESIPAGEWEEIDQFLQRENVDGGPSLTFSGLARALMKGDAREAGRMILDGLKESLLAEVAHGGRLAGELLALGLVGAIFSSFSSIFTGSPISETAFFMTYLLAFSLLAAAFSDSARIVEEVLGRQTSFMEVLLPSYFLTVAWAGGSLSSAAWMELVLFLIGAVQWLYLKLLLPLGQIYILLVMAGNMAKEDMLSRLTELLKTGIQWGTRSLVGVVLGFQLVQGIVLPYADAAQTAGLQRLLQAIPGVGDGMGAVTKMVLGSGVLVKNTMGAAAVVVLLVLSLVPIVKLAVLLFLYRAVAAVLQPVGDKRLVACIGSVADGQKLLLGMASSGLVLFVITIALICVGTNVAFLA